MCPLRSSIVSILKDLPTLQKQQKHENISNKERCGADEKTQIQNLMFHDALHCSTCDVERTGYWWQQSGMA